MCGIAGIYNDQKINLKDVISLSNTLKHRGPDDEGFCLSNKDNYLSFYKGDDTIDELNQIKHISEDNSSPVLALIHRRLSIIDISAQGHQPFVSANKRFVLIYNGEIYNFKEIRIQLQEKGYQFTSNTDTEVVLNAFIEWGENCVNHFVGMWAFVIFDKVKNILTLSRDRYGIKPLYFYKKGTYFTFASEIKALLTLSKIDKTLSEEHLGSYLAFGVTSKPYQNLFDNIYDILPGYNYQLNLQTGNLTKKSYYSLQQKGINTDDIQKNTKKFEELFNNSIALHLRSDVEIGSCLSGGLDSSAIVYSASKQLKKSNLNTFTAAYNNPDIDESSYAKLVANSLPNVSDIYTYPSAKNLIKDLEKVIYHQDLPIASTSIFAQWEVMKCANKHNTKVLLDGQGADEILGGYYNFAGIYLIELLKKLKFNLFLKEYNFLKQNFTPKIKTAILRAAYYYLPYRLQQKLREKERLSYQFIHPNKIQELKLEIPKRGGKTFQNHAQLSVKYGLYDLLRYEDRNSMAFSIESRVPFLDHRLVDFIMQLPTNQKIYQGWTKYILRKSIDKKLNKKIVWRKDKKGFVTPQQDWKNELMTSLISELKQSNIPSLMNREYVLQLCDSNLSNANHLSEFWRAYTVVKWYNVFNLNA